MISKVKPGSLLTAGLTLFAGQGFRRTTVGEIEAAAGFTARGGTLYKHFPSKQALLDTAVARHVDRVRALRRTADLLPLGEFGSELTLLMRSLLVELEEERLITLLLEKEGDSRALTNEFLPGEGVGEGE